MLVDLYIYYEDFYEKSVYQMSLNSGRMTTTQGANVSFMRIIYFSSLYLLVKSFDEEIQPSRDHMDTA